MAKLDEMALVGAADGMVLVDKPANLSSHDLLKAVKTRFNIVKAGLGATLEPNATGVIAVLVGDGTHFAKDLMDVDRDHEITIRLGRVTDTQDRDGRTIEERPVPALSPEAVEAARKEFLGDIFQTPPPFAVYKRPDRTSCDIAPADPSDLRPRLVHVYRIAVSGINLPLVSLEVFCTKGVNMCALAHDFGRTLGCGACLESSRRTGLGRFGVADSIGFMDLLKLDVSGFLSRIVPMTEVLAR